MTQVMSKAKYLVAFVIAAVLAMAMAGTAFAGSITITTDKTYNTGSSANVYSAYKIFDASYESLTGTNTQNAKDPTYTPNDAAVAYFMKTGNPWISTVQGMTDYFTVTAAADGSGYNVVLKDGVANNATTAQAIATALKTALTTVNPSGDYAAKTITAGGGAVTVDNGYYLLTSDTATNLALVTTDVTIVEKNEYITDKKVAETASVTVGENATYYVKVAIPANVDTTIPVIVHDEMAAALSFNNDVKVYEGTTDPGDDAAAFKALTYGNLGAAYTVKTTGITDHCAFEISINTANLAGKYLVFKYTAQLTSAAVADNGYVNKEFTSYGNYETTPTEPEVKTYDFDFTKVDGNDAKLDGAQFELRNTATGDAIALLADGNNYKLADRDDTGTVTTITVNSKTNNAATKISGLGGTAAGRDYYLVETKAPKGFNQLTNPVVVNVMDDGTMTFTLGGEELSSPNDAFNVVNQSGTVLPSTGGMGTTILYIVGGIMVLVAAVVLITKRRVSKINK